MVVQLRTGSKWCVCDASFPTISFGASMHTPFSKLPLSERIRSRAFIVKVASHMRFKSKFFKLLYYKNVKIYMGYTAGLIFSHTFYPSLTIYIHGTTSWKCPNFFFFSISSYDKKCCKQLTPDLALLLLLASGGKSHQN